jgi:hypothetical protein
MSGLAVFVTSAAFTATTDNPDNQIVAGSVAVSDSDGGGAAAVLYSALNQKPGAANGPVAKCIRVTYSGSLAADLKLYASAIANGSSFHLKVERGAGITTPGANMNCVGFTQSSDAFDASLNTFPTTYGTGLDGKAAGAAWTTGNTVDYRFTVYAEDDATPNAHTTTKDSGTHTYTWEARNN